MDLSIYITATVSLISVIATSLVSILINRSNNKREIAKLEHDYRLKVMSSNKQMERDVYIDTFRKMTNVLDEILSLSVEAHSITKDMTKKRTEYPSYFDKKYDKLKEHYLELQSHLVAVEIFASNICEWHYVVFLQVVHSIMNKGSGQFTSIAFLNSELFEELWNTLQNCKNNFLDQCKCELTISKSDKREIFNLSAADGYAYGYIMIKEKSNEVVLFAGSETKKILKKDCWKDNFNYVMSHNCSFNTTKDAIAYLIGDNEQYEFRSVYLAS